MAYFDGRLALVLAVVAPWVGACADDSSVAGGGEGDSSGTAGSSSSGMATVGMTMGGSSSGADGTTGDPADGSTGDPPGGSTAAGGSTMGEPTTGASSDGASSSDAGSSDGASTDGDGSTDGGSTEGGTTDDGGTTGFGSTGFGSTGFGSTGFGSSGFGSSGFGSTDGGSTDGGSTSDGGSTGFGSSDGGTTTGFDSGNCCLTHPTPGCEDAACTAVVCGTAPECCIFEWDGVCTALADGTAPCVCDGTGTGGDTAGDTGATTGGPPVGFVLISELRYDTPGADEDVFIELVGTPDLPLDGVSLVAVNGASGMVYDSLDLDGEVVPSNGVFVIVDPASTSIFLNEAADLFSDFADIQNGPDNLVLVRDGAVVDAIGYGVFAADETFVGEGSPAQDINTVQSLYRAFSTVDTDDNSVDFQPGEFTAGLVNPGFGDCCAANGSPGCEELVCQGLVCDVDGTCCTVDWDAACVAVADVQIFCPPCS